MTNTDELPETQQTEGHAAHSKIAPSNQGLPGIMPRPIKLTVLGAGSGFTPTLLKDVLRIPGNEAGGTIALVDIDVERLTMMQKVIHRLLAVFGQSENWTVEATTDRCQALPGSHYVTNCIEVAGLACVRHDNDIPARYGVDQCIGDTIGPGGLFKALRTVPVFLDVLRDVERLCPEAIVLNYTNPMAMMCLAAARAVPSVSVVGLCHSVQGTSDMLAKRAGVPYSDLQWECAGINHLAWFTRLEYQGRDLYPLLMEQARRELADPSAEPSHEPDLIRKDMMLNFGAFITESSGHLSEYLPYYRKRKDLLARYARPGYDGQTSFYADNWPEWRARADKERGELVRGEREFEQWRTWEYASWIIEAREKNQLFRIHGNVPNAGRLIENLPEDGCVEVACLVDGNGIQPTRYGKLPAQMAGLCASNMAMFDLGATAVIEHSKEAAIHALMLDPLTAAVCSPSEIRAMTEELFAAEAEFLPGFR